ncbi:hypothetical protein PHMEG_00017328 [Phytophthora megakarya]|uniref:M96 mating-specific protein n=1 Tax=Phytophthora megakarya TaxID=4795 RepID=A0A225VZ71_9STRA|nr:hypothetical protein PHMEG_00017328 [Phytophthora megakarya]
MDALDHVELVPDKRNQTNLPKKRKVDDSGGCGSSENKKQPSWMKRKQELQTLRQATQAMETRVIYLKMQKISSRKELNSLKQQKIAKLEKQKCIAAQSENERLKAKIQFYSRQYEAFQKILMDFQVEGSLSSEIGAGKQFQCCGSQVFDMLERRMDARFHELEDAFQVMQQPPTSADFELIQKKNEERGTVEFTSFDLLPFENDVVSTTMWDFVMAGKFPDGELAIIHRRSEDSMAASTRVTVQIDGGGIAIIDTHSVMKRFVTPEGYAVMTEGCSEWNINSPDSGSWSHSTREGGCFVLRDYSNNPGICQSRARKSTKPYKNPNPRWKRVKEELQSLRAEKNTLEAQVAFLKLRDTHIKLYESCMTTTKEQDFWKAAAMIEEQRSQQAQEKNSELKSMIERCKKTCDALQTALKTPEVKNLQTMTKTIAARSLRIEINTRHKLQMHNSTIFNWLECRMSARSHELESLLRQNQVFTDSDLVQMYPHNPANAASIAEFVHTRSLPFSVERTSSAAWEIMKRGGFPNERSVPGQTDDVLASEGCSRHPLNCGGTAELRSHVLKKRIAIPGGFAVLVESISEWLASPSSLTPWRYITQESGWALVHSLKGNNSPDICRVQTMLRLTTANTDGVGYFYQNQTRSRFSNTVGEVVIPSFREMINSRHQLLDNTLLDSSHEREAN